MPEKSLYADAQYATTIMDDVNRFDAINQSFAPKPINVITYGQGWA